MEGRFSDKENKKEFEDFYPNDVDKITQKAGTVSETEKATTFVALGCIINVGLFLVLPPFLAKMGAGYLVGIIIQILLNLVVGSIVFRYFVFKEPERIKEYKSYNLDSFARFFKMGKEPVMQIEVEGYGDVDVFGYSDGMYLVALHLRYGSNDNEKDKRTKRALQEIFKILCRAELNYKVVYSDEDFYESEEFKNYIKKINKGVYKDTMLRIFNYALDHVPAPNVTATTILISTRAKYQIYDLSVVLANILTVANSNFNAFRSAEYMNFTQFIEFVRFYYGLEVIDLSMVKAISSDRYKLSDYFDKVNIYKIVTNKGVYVNNKPIKEKMATASEEVKGR